MKRPLTIYFAAILILCTFSWPLSFILVVPFYTGTVVFIALMSLISWASLKLVRDGNMVAFAGICCWLMLTLPVGALRVLILLGDTTPSPLEATAFS